MFTAADPHQLYCMPGMAPWCEQIKISELCDIGEMNSLCLTVGEDSKVVSQCIAAHGCAWSKRPASQCVRRLVKASDVRDIFIGGGGGQGGAFPPP